MFWSVFLILIAIGLLYFVYGMVVRCTGLPGRCHMTLTSFSWFNGQSEGFEFWPFFLILYAIGQLYLVYGNIL